MWNVIQTRALVGVRGARNLSARSPTREDCTKVRIPYTLGISTDRNHAAVARQFAIQHDWAGLWQGGCTGKGHRVFVRVAYSDGPTEGFGEEFTEWFYVYPEGHTDNETE